MRDGAGGLLEALRASQAQLVLEVDVRRREERVDAVPRRVAHGGEAAVDVLLGRPREAGDDHGQAVADVRESDAPDLLRDDRDGFKVPGACDREPGLADVHAEARELVGCKRRRGPCREVTCARARAE